MNRAIVAICMWEHLTWKLRPTEVPNWVNKRWGPLLLSTLCNLLLWHEWDFNQVKIMQKSAQFKHTPGVSAITKQMLNTYWFDIIRIKPRGQKTLRDSLVRRHESNKDRCLLNKMCAKQRLKCNAYISDVHKGCSFLRSPLRRRRWTLDLGSVLIKDKDLSAQQ